MKIEIENIIPAGNDFFNKFSDNDVIYNHFPFLVIITDNHSVTRIRVEKRLRDVLKYHDDVLVLKIWEGEWSSQYNSFTVGQFKNHLKAEEEKLNFQELGDHKLIFHVGSGGKVHDVTVKPYNSELNTQFANYGKRLNTLKLALEIAPEYVIIELDNRRGGGREMITGKKWNDNSHRITLI